MYMRRLLLVVAGVLLLVPELPAKSDDWKNVEKMKWDLPVRIELWNGSEFAGRFASADDANLRIKLWTNNRSGQTAEGQSFPREQVRIVETMSNRDPDLAAYQKVGMVGGGAAGAIGLGLAVRRSAWPAGALFGGLLGIGVGAMIGDTAALVTHVSARHRKLIYQAQQPPPAETKP